MGRPIAQRSHSWFIAVGVISAAFAVGCSSTRHSSAESANKAQAAAQSATTVLEGRKAPNDAPSSTSTERPPSWLTEFPADQSYFIGIAGSPDTGDPSTDVEKARKNARNALAAEIETTIQSDTNLQSRDNSKGDAQDSLTVLINERVNLRISGIELVDSYHSQKWGYWFYYRIPREALDPRPAISKGVHELLGQLHAAVTLSFGGITFADSGLSSSLSLYLENQLLLALRGEEGVTVTAQPPTTIVTRENAGKEAADSKTDLLGETEANRAVLTGIFFGESAGKVPVFLRLTNQSSKEIIASSSFTLDMSSLPASLSILPTNYTAAISIKEEIATLQQGPETAFRIRLWTDRGNGATFLDGEYLVVNFSATVDCYLKIYHIDVNGHAALILPNRYLRDNFFKAGRIYQIPSPGASYQFLLGRPYGVEFIKVIASTEQFDNVEESFADLGQATRSLLTRGLSIAGTGYVRTAEALMNYTILGRTQ